MTVVIALDPAQALGLQPALVPLAYETAPASSCAAGNGASEGGLKSPPDAPASDPAPVESVAGSDVALDPVTAEYLIQPCDCDAHRYIRTSMQDPAFAEAIARVHARQQREAVVPAPPWDPCACGHPWLRHDVNEYRGDGSETCCVEGCDQNGCPGKAVARTLDAAVATADQNRNPPLPT